MAINTTTLNGTDSVAASRITINDNFNTLVDALNDVLSIIDIATGKINNYGYGSNNDMETEDLIVRGSVNGGIDVISGNVNVGNGNVIIGGTAGTGYLRIGTGTNAIYFEKIAKTLFGIPSSSVATANLSGTGATGGTGPVAYVNLPRLDLATVKLINWPQIGSLVNIVNTGGTGCYLAVCMETGVTGMWYQITTGATAL
jgi:hypothetical protein